MSLFHLCHVFFSEQADREAEQKCHFENRRKQNIKKQCGSLLTYSFEIQCILIKISLMWGSYCFGESLQLLVHIISPQRKSNWVIVWILVSLFTSNYIRRNIKTYEYNHATMQTFEKVFFYTRLNTFREKTKLSRVFKWSAEYDSDWLIKLNKGQNRLMIMVYFWYIIWTITEWFWSLSLLWAF